ncbi:hypothetical protein BH20VER1_BH20VER1_22800 [soil metagenome]
MIYRPRNLTVFLFLCLCGCTQSAPPLPQGVYRLSDTTFETDGKRKESNQHLKKDFVETNTVRVWLRSNGTFDFTISEIKETLSGTFGTGKDRKLFFSPDLFALIFGIGGGLESECVQRGSEVIACSGTLPAPTGEKHTLTIVFEKQ